MNSRTQYLTVRKYMEWRERGLLSHLEPMFDESRWDLLTREFGNGPAAHLEKFNNIVGLEARMGDARRSGLAAASVDFVCSNNTFEHIPALVLKAILIEFRRVIKPGGLMSHFIDLSDHFAHFDPSITIYNFLKFSPRLWSLIDNRIQPQNRLRFRDYLSMYEELGLPVTVTDFRPGIPEDLDRVRPDSSFSGYTREELAISHGYIVSCFSGVSQGTVP